MANRRTIGSVIGAVALATVAGIYQENIAAWLEVHKLNHLLLQIDVAAAFGSIGRFLISPWLTHLYAALAGIILLAVLQGIARSSNASTSDIARGCVKTPSLKNLRAFPSAREGIFASCRTISVAGISHCGKLF